MRAATSVTAEGSGPSSGSDEDRQGQEQAAGPGAFGLLAWFNTTRLHSAIEHLPPEQFEAIYYAQYQPNEALAINR